jgi:FMN phosphatase YigB (HAD superfamily)
MIKILMLDLGDTLAHDDSVFPHVPEALETLRSFKTTAGKPLQLALVSDFLMPDPPVTPAKIDQLFKQYIEILKQLNLSEFFKPFKRHITLSTHAGVGKPDRHIFELAITRLGVDSSLSDCLFITENADHISACQQLGMKTLRFASEAGGGDFDDWSEAPLLVSQLMDPGHSSNFQSALKLALSSKHEMELLSMEKKKAGAKVRARAQQWHSVPNPKAGKKENVEVPIPVDVEIDLNKKGGIRSVKADQPDPEAVADAASFVETLAANEQVTDKPGPLPPGATHRIETDEKGRKRLVRKRFSAI